MIVNTEESYSSRQMKRHARMLLGDQLDQPPLNTSSLHREFREIAGSTYWTTFTDDSDYIEDGISLSLLVTSYLNHPESRDEIKHFVDNVLTGNWIVNSYRRDFWESIESRQPSSI
jgi:hypothetical protein